MVKVTGENFNLIAAKYYDDIGGTDLDFQEDLRRFLLIKRLLNSYRKSGDLKYRLVLNHIIIVLNVFGDAAVGLMFHELYDYLPEIVPFLILLKRLPENVNGLNTSSIKMDSGVVSCLRCI